MQNSLLADTVGYFTRERADGRTVGPPRRYPEGVGAVLGTVAGAVTVTLVDGE